MRLSRSYQAALGAAESALAGDIPTVAAEALDRRPVHSLWQVRQELGRSVLEQPDQLGARFDRYIEAVAAHCGYRVEAARAHLEVGFERIAEPLVGTGALDERSLFALRGDLDRAASEARTTVDLFLAYRRAVADVSQAVARPAPARHDRGLRVAVEFIGQHYAEPLRREHVARLSGFSPTYFSRLFRKREGMPFETYVLGLRLERAKQLLASTDLAVVRVAELSGFNSHAYFCRAFRRALGATPAGYRERPGDVQRRADRYKQFATKGKGPVASRPIR
jgi:AraC-like DNA-binding protein